MVVRMHVLYPCDERRRVWLEEVVLVTTAVGKPLFS